MQKCLHIFQSMNVFAGQKKKNCTHVAALGNHWLHLSNQFIILLLPYLIITQYVPLDNFLI